MKPKLATMKAILRAAGGEVADKLPKEKESHLIAVSCADDRRTYAPLLKQPHTCVLRADHVLTCVMRQNLYLKSGRLS